MSTYLVTPYLPDGAYPSIFVKADTPEEAIETAWQGELRLIDRARAYLVVAECRP